ncbi:MAG: hypothetical protein ACI92I_000100 [Acidimicrobiales bacterium]|jgi:hypothetical protein
MSAGKENLFTGSVQVIAIFTKVKIAGNLH